MRPASDQVVEADSGGWPVSDQVIEVDGGGCGQYQTRSLRLMVVGEASIRPGR